jgi:hypothetical protein
MTLNNLKKINNITTKVVTVTLTKAYFDKRIYDDLEGYKSAFNKYVEECIGVFDK